MAHRSTLLLLLLLAGPMASAQIDRDKALHFLGGNLFGLAGAGIAKQASDGNRFATFMGAVGGATLVGVAKEAVDASQRDNEWDNGDLIATILGGVTIGIAVDLFTNHRRDQRHRGGLVGSLDSASGQSDWPLLPEEWDDPGFEDGVPNLSALGLSQGLVVRSALP